MGGGKRSKHKNRHNAQKASAENKGCENPTSKQEVVEEPVSLGNADITESEVMSVDCPVQEPTAVLTRGEDTNKKAPNLTWTTKKHGKPLGTTESDIFKGEIFPSLPGQGEGPMVSQNKKKSRWGKVGEPCLPDDSKNQNEDRKDNDVKPDRKGKDYRDDNITKSRKCDDEEYPNDNSWKSNLYQKKVYKEEKPRRSDSSRSKDRSHSRSNSKSRDPHFDYWDKKLRNSEKEEGTNVNEKFGDLFLASDEYALAHCVAEDMNMGSGIAVQFRRTFKRVDELLQQRVTQGGVAILDINNRYVYYLVTKRYSNGKPTYLTLFRSLCAMKDHVVQNGVQKIAVPRIGCGLDGLEWRCVKSMLQYIFHDVNVEIVVYNFQQDDFSSNPMPPQTKRKCPVVNVLKKVIEIEEYTTILYTCSMKRHITDLMKELDKKFNIVKAYENDKRDLGSVVRTEYKNTYILYGMVVQEKPEDLLNYQHFQRCIEQVRKFNRKDQSAYMALQGFEEPRDKLIVSKLVNIMRNTFMDVHVYICWPKELQHLAPRDTDYS